jgi:hypothetical protein
VQELGWCKQQWPGYRLVQGDRSGQLAMLGTQLHQLSRQQLEHARSMTLCFALHVPQRNVSHMRCKLNQQKTITVWPSQYNPWQQGTRVLQYAAAYMHNMHNSMPLHQHMYTMVATCRPAPTHTPPAQHKQCPKHATPERSLQETVTLGGVLYSSQHAPTSQTAAVVLAAAGGVTASVTPAPLQHAAHHMPPSTFTHTPPAKPNSVQSMLRRGEACRRLSPLGGVLCSSRHAPAKPITTSKPDHNQNTRPQGHPVPKP